MNERARQIYYQLKPFIPRELQLYLRRKIATKRKAACFGNWPIDKNAGHPPRSWEGWPEGKKFAIVLTHDVETLKGLAKCLPLIELEKRLGFRSCFNFVAEECPPEPQLYDLLVRLGFEVGVHGLKHNGNIFREKKLFLESAAQINRFLKKWKSVGFRAPSMFHNLEWIHNLEIEYDSSTFDTDPFEPQPDGVGTIFPFWVNNESRDKGYVELPYTLPQDFTLFIIMREKNIDIWKKKIDWIAECRGMALLITHPDYMNYAGFKLKADEYPAKYYEEFLEYVKSKYENQYWNAIPKEMARFWLKYRDV